MTKVDSVACWLAVHHYRLDTVVLVIRIRQDETSKSSKIFIVCCRPTATWKDAVRHCTNTCDSYILVTIAVTGLLQLPVVRCADSLIRKLQSVQNAAARLITGARRCDHITPVLRQLHWLPLRRWVDYKVACLVHQSLSGHAPRYLADDINLVANSGRCLL